MARLSTWQVYPSTTPGQYQLLGHNYTYDRGGNISSILDWVNGQTQNYTYDERDRLTHAYTTGSSTNAYDQSYSYDVLGNFKTKAGVSYSYTNGHPHQASSIGSQSYTYDPNGNVSSDGVRSYTWNVDNQPTVISDTTYTYNSDNERVTSYQPSHTAGTTASPITYLEGMWEESSITQTTPSNTITQSSRLLYQFGGQVIAERSFNSVNGGAVTNNLTYLHSDHIGSVSLATDGNTGSKVSQQDFDPWGAPRAGSGTIAQTDVNYTGQVKDSSTGLLYYHSRYYDPIVGRFTSPDSIVPGAALGKGGVAATLGVDDKIELRALTVDFHEPGFVKELGKENTFTVQKGFWFQLGSEDFQQAKTPNGPANPQNLNRYSYVLNNPVLHTDPTGHHDPEDDGSSNVPYIKPGSSGGPSAYQRFPSSVKGQAFDADPTKTCVYCGRTGTGTQVDHAIPRSRGGNASLANAQLACPHCNASKGATSFPRSQPEGYEGEWPPHWWGSGGNGGGGSGGSAGGSYAGPETNGGGKSVQEES